jgi:tetratricopeptide (TPR) repeat protein
MNMRNAVLTAMLLAGFSMGASAQVASGSASAPQPVAAHIALGDSLHHRSEIDRAMKHYELVLESDAKNYEALWKASREAVDLGEFNPNRAEQTRLYQLAEQYARRAVAVDSADAEGHFSLARALGRNALRMGTRDRIKYAGVIRAEALAALKDKPQHPGALHVMGVWNAEVMRLNGFSRMVAKNFLGGKIFDQASWDEAQRYMEASVAAEPNRLVHHLDLAKVYADRGMKDKAREQFELVVKGDATEYNDKFYKEDATKRLKEL